MNADNYPHGWQTRSMNTRLTIDADVLLQMVRRNQRSFTSTIFWRDVREVGVAFLMVPLWLYMGVNSALPWTWYLTVPALVWIGGFMLVDRLWHKRHTSGPGEPLRLRVESSLSQVEHQIWLLRNIFWWYLLPLVLPMLAFFGQVAWQTRAGGWLTALVVAGVVMVTVFVFAFIYWLNQFAVRTELEPRRQELKSLLMSLNDETPPASS